MSTELDTRLIKALDSITDRDYPALYKRLQHGPATQAELVELLGNAQSIISQMLKRLIVCGLVKRVAVTSRSGAYVAVAREYQNIDRVADFAILFERQASLNLQRDYCKATYGELP